MAPASGFTWPLGKAQRDEAHLAGAINAQSGLSGEKHEQSGTSRVAFLEAELQITRSHNLNLQRHVAFLQTQMSCRLGHITKLKTKIKALESEMMSLKANPVPVSSKAAHSVAADSLEATPIAEGSTPPRSPASTPAQDLHRQLPDQHREPAPPAPGSVGNYALWDLRPNADGSGAALTSSGQGECGAVPSETTVQATRSPSSTQAPENTAITPPSCTHKASAAEISSVVVAEQADKSSSCSSATATASKASATSRHPLHDFWVDSRDYSPPARNTRIHGLQDDSMRQRAKSSLPNGHVVSDGAMADGETSLDPVHDNAGQKAREQGLHEPGVHLEGLDQDGRAVLKGEKGDFFVEQCPRCIHDCDGSFAAPSPGAVPMEHLLNELLRHDLSVCFREPVDTDRHPDYVESVGRDAMMDLGTMLDKLKRKKYPRRRGPGQFLDDLNRIWRNCRRYAGCDELGKPHYGKTVPGIVRCALILEAMSIKFCAAYMSNNQWTEAWQESTWDFHRERQERMNAEARLEQLKHLGKSSGIKKAKPLESSDGVAGTLPSESCRTAAGRSITPSRNVAVRHGEENPK
eukprot:g15697.t1